MVLTFLGLGTYILMEVPPNERTLANLEAKFAYVHRLLGGEVEKENKDLTLQLQAEKRKEAGLQLEEHDLDKKLFQARHIQGDLQQQLRIKESNYKAAEKDATRARQGMQSWEHTSSELRSELASVKKNAVQNHRDLQRSLREASVAEEHSRSLENALASARQQIAKLEAEQNHLTGQLRKEEQWHQDTVQKFRRFRNAEQALIKSIDVESKFLPIS